MGKHGPRGNMGRLLLGCGLLMLAACQMMTGVEGVGSPSRHLNVFGAFPRHKKIATAILSGDIDRAAELVVNAVKEGDGVSIVKGFSEAQSLPGKKFSVVQTVLRALGMGVSRDELERVVRSGGEAEPGGGQIVDDVSTVLHGTSGTTPVAAEQPAPTPTYYVQGGGYPVTPTTTTTTTATTIGGTTTTTTPSAVTSSHQHILVHGPAHYQTTSTPAPTAGVPRYTVMVDPMDASGVFVEQQSIRMCRGVKEEQCCKEYNEQFPGCSCDLANNCRFQFIHNNPVIIQDTRRQGLADQVSLWMCWCEYS